jgi:hypothetical protein
VKPKPTYADLAGSRYLALQRLARAQQRASAELLIVEIASVHLDDGVVFLPDTITVAAIRDDDAYPGVRAGLDAHLATARLKFSVDLNVGDPVVPAPVRTAIPVLLDGEPIHVLAYPKAMVVAEKLVTVLQRGRANTRWRDFADLFVLVPSDLDDSEVVDAQGRWATWRKRQGAEAVVPQDLGTVLDALHERTQTWLSRAGAHAPTERST